MPILDAQAILVLDSSIQTVPSSKASSASRRFETALFARPPEVAHCSHPLDTNALARTDGPVSDALHRAHGSVPDQTCAADCSTSDEARAADGDGAGEPCLGAGDPLNEFLKIDLGTGDPSRPGLGLPIVPSLYMLEAGDRNKSGEWSMFKLDPGKTERVGEGVRGSEEMDTRLGREGDGVRGGAVKVLDLEQDAKEGTCLVLRAN
ncbi:hypothetical protein BN14_04986 [Rhizoctonia solani AG-1 IB]|uniref:Uncharacterized protein n=1 Tax=Thanatephorus cucumeris (strain AG1-IB / isolate 7/3/14) TaxID=1108050 RepID=M5C4Y1_THACB|nr:hypothetical protein BN14_04986 [Rhizoctonia solani AG-1 IB]